LSSDTSISPEWLSIQGTSPASSSSNFSVFSLGSDDEDGDLGPASSSQGYEMVSFQTGDGQGLVNVDHDYEVWLYNLPCQAEANIFSTSQINLMETSTYAL
jgi:hypothetical protein